MHFFFLFIHLVLFTNIFCRVLTAVSKGDWAVIFFAVLFLADSGIKHMFALWEELGRFSNFIGCAAVLGRNRHFLSLKFSVPLWRWAAVAGECGF